MGEEEYLNLTFDTALGFINHTPIESEQGVYNIEITCEDYQHIVSDNFNYTIIDTTVPVIDNTDYLTTTKRLAPATFYINTTDYGVVCSIRYAQAKSDKCVILVRFIEYRT